MKQEIAKLWVDALRSGQYKQTIGSLETANGNCCLGVLCRLAQKQGILKDSEIRYADARTYFAGMSAYLPVSILNWSGVHTRSGSCTIGDEQHCLSAKNDDGENFTKIADFIEQNIEVL